MPMYGTTTTGTFGTSEAAATVIKIPGGAIIRKIHALSITGTGVVYQLRFEFTGMKLPQTYLLPVLNALEGTEVGSGQKAATPLDVYIPVGSNAVDLTIYGLASAATQTCVVGIIYEAS